MEGNLKNLYEQSERMIELINYNSGDYKEEDNVAILYEGLIRTVSLNKAQVLLSRWFKSYNIPDYYGEALQYRNVEIRQHDTLSIYILDIVDDKEKLKNLLSYINNLGYQISLILTKKIGDKNRNEEKFTEDNLYSFIGQGNNLEYIYIVLEAKFDVEIDKKDFPDKLYHITRQDVLHKIKKIGLTPRTKSKKSTHTERVYFAKTYEDAYDIYVQFKKGYSDQKYAILEINPKLVNYLRLFDDPNFKGYGYYGLVNVPPSAIKILKENL